MIYQELSLCPHLSVAENILLGMEPATRAGLRRRRDPPPRSDALEQLGHGGYPAAMLAGRALDRRGSSSSRSPAPSRVGCRVLVLDEPTSSLAQAISSSCSS